MGICGVRRGYCPGLYRLRLYLEVYVGEPYFLGVGRIGVWYLEVYVGEPSFLGAPKNLVYCAIIIPSGRVNGTQHFGWRRG